MKGEPSEEDKLGIPMLPGFKGKILPVLIVYSIATALFTLLGEPIALVVGSWATVTTIMLWPVGKALGRRYTTYKTSWFIIGVVSMIGIPLFGYLIIISNDPLTKYVSVVALVLDIGVWGIPLSTKSAFSHPVSMLFRPDLLFGDGRLLAGGIVAVGFGMVNIFGPPGAMPKGNWYALFLVIILGLIQIIPLRGMMKMRNRISRLLFDKWNSYFATVVKESYLIIAIAALMFGLHNFFGGVTPFTMNVLAGSSEGLVIMATFAFFVILARAWYKKYKIGDPFVVESIAQSIVKHSIFGIGLVGFLYGYLNVMIGSFPRLPNAGNYLHQSTIGSLMLVWGLTLLVPIRAWAQGNQRGAMMRQMVEIVLPSLNEDLRAKGMKKVVDAVSDLPEGSRLRIVKDMVSFLREMEDKDKEKVMKTQFQLISSLPSEKRMVMIRAMDHAMMSQSPS